MKLKTTTKQELEEAAKNSHSKTDLLSKYGLPPYGGNYRTLDRKLKAWNVDISHFNPYKNYKPPAGHNKRELSDILVENSTYSSTHALKLRLIKEGILEDKCSECGIEKWNGKDISLHLDHINGINDDNRISNLRLLCPNCHSQTPTYAGKNKQR